MIRRLQPPQVTMALLLLAVMVFMVVSTMTTVVVVNAWIAPFPSISKTRTTCSRHRILSFARTTVPTVWATPVNTATAATGTEEDDDADADLEIEILDVDDDDDDDDDYDFDEDDIPEFTLAEAKAKMDAWMQELQHLARTSARDTQAVNKAQAILNDMFELYVQTEDEDDDGGLGSTFFPTTQVYNCILEAHAYSKNENGADEAMELLQKMHDTDNVYIARPNVETYLNVMDAFAMRRNPAQVQKLLEQQQERAETTSYADLAVTVDAYNKLIKAYGIFGDMEQAQSVFQTLVDNGTANQKSWVQLMKAHFSQNDDGGAAKVEALFEKMQAEATNNSELEPTIDAYNVLIRAIGVTQGPAKAEAKLYELMNRYRQGDVVCQPNADTFRHVIFAYNQDRTQQHSAGTVSKLDQLLQIQDSFITMSSTSTPWTMDERLYIIVMGIIARSKDPHKAVRVQRMMGRFQKAAPADSTSSGTLRRMYASQLSACAYIPKDATAEDKQTAFDIAERVWKTLSTDDMSSPTDVQLDSSMASNFIMSCRTLLPASDRRDAIVQSAFDECCQRGIVNDSVMNEVEAVTDGATQLQWFGGFIEDGVRVKKEWRRNVVDNKR